MRGTNGQMKSKLLLLCLLSLFFECSAGLASEPENHAYSSEVLADDPVCFFGFQADDTKDETVARNSSRSKEPGPAGVFNRTINLVAGPELVTKRAVEFDGTGYFEIPNHAVFESNELTVEFWFRSTQTWDQK